MCPEITCESVLITALLVDKARSFVSARMTASYFAELLVHWNSSLAAYQSLMPEGEVSIAAIPAPDEPHAPCVCTIQIGSVTFAVLCV
jgi:hypothetical protein